MEEQRYPVSQADFETIRERGFVYVDKTEYIHRLVSDGVFYFLGRPRRFGKSLLISTIKTYFENKRELFKGLAVDRLQPGANVPNSWQKSSSGSCSLTDIRYAQSPLTTVPSFVLTG